MLTHFSISQQGSRHIEKGVVCQDYSASKRIIVEHLKREIVIAAVADGVGSCEYSQIGSAIAVQSFLDYVEDNLQNKMSELSNENILKIIECSFDYSLSQVEKESEEREIPFLAYDSTLTGIVYDGHNLWYGHIGDDGVVVLYSDGEYEMITKRHKGEEAHSLYPLRQTDLWQFGRSLKEVASCVLMTDGVLDYCVDVERMGNRVYFPFLEPALTEAAFTDEDAEKQRIDWYEYLSGNGNYPENFRKKVTDDISFVVVQNPELIKSMSPVQFDFDKWDDDTAKRKKELDDALYADYRAYKAGTYQSPVKRSPAHYIEKAPEKKTNIQENQTNLSDSVFRKNNGTLPKQIDRKCIVESEASDDIEDLCAEAAGAIKDVLKSAHSVGELVRKKLAPKQKRNQHLQESTDSEDEKDVRSNHSSEGRSETRCHARQKETTDQETVTKSNHG